MKDWLGNELSVGDPVLYSSTSTLTGMNLGEVTKIEDSKIQIRLWHLTKHTWSTGHLITLRTGTSAYKSVTRYFGTISQEYNGKV